MIVLRKFWKNNWNLATSCSVHFIRQTQTKIPHEKKAVANLCDKLNCSENVAKNIYMKFPSLRSNDAIKDDALKLLQNNVSLEFIAEYPSLLTLDIDVLKERLDKVKLLQPKNLDDFAPLLILSSKELNKLIKLFAKEEDQIKEKNRIYYLSNILNVEPRDIAKYRADFGHEIFYSSFTIFRKKLDILLNYGVSPSEILESLYILRVRDNVFVPRCERLMSAGVPIKLWYFKIPDNEFDLFVRSKASTNHKKLSKNITSQLKKWDLKKTSIVQTLMRLLQCSISESLEIYHSYLNKDIKISDIEKNVNYFRQNGVGIDVIKANGFLLAMPLSDIETKLITLNRMEPRTVEDIIPLMRLDSVTLENYESTLRMRELNNHIGMNHPVYYFSEKLKLPPCVVSKNFAENTRFIKDNPDLLKRKLDVLVKHNVDPISILKNQTTFSLSAEYIEEIICRLKENGIKSILSWMIIPFSSPQHDKLILDHHREEEARSGSEDNINYLAHRLGWDDGHTQIILLKYPMLAKTSASKIKSHLDYFLNETKFTVQDITKAPYILTQNLDEMKSRICEMKEIDAPITLPIVYQSKSRYLKYTKQFCESAYNKEESTKVYRKIEERVRQRMFGRKSK